MSSSSSNPSSNPPPRRASSSGGSQLGQNPPRRLQLATGAAIPPPPSRGLSFASIAASAQGTPSSSSAGPSAVITPAGTRRQSVPSSPSPRIHRATSSTSAWGPAGHSIGNVVTPSTPSPSSFPGGLMGAANADMSLGTPSIPPPPATFFSRPPYLEHTAFRHLFKKDIFQSLAPTTTTTSSGPSNAPSSASPAKPSITSASSGALHRRSIYSPAYLMGGALPSESTSSSAANSDVEDSDSAAPRTARPRDSQALKQLTIRPEEEVFTLPTCWNDADRHASIHISTTGTELTFMGIHGHLHGMDNKDEAAAARTNNPVPPICGVYYYEVEVLDRGNKGHIGVGFATKLHKTNKMPGWETHSWGYHADDGRLFSSEGEQPFGPRFSTADVVGCGIDFSTGRIFFTKNAVFLGITNPPITPFTDLYPCIGLRSSRERVSTNFGQYPFKFDIEAYVLQTRSKAWKESIQKSTTIQWQMDQMGMKVSRYPDSAPVPTATTTGGAFGVPHITIAPRQESEGGAGFTLPPISTSGFSISPHELASASSSDPADTSPLVVGREVAGDNPQIVVRELVLEYLIQSGYPATARAFKLQSDQQQHDEGAAETAVAAADDKRLGAGWRSKTKASSSKASTREQNGDTKMVDGEGSGALPPGVKSRPIGPSMNVEDSLQRRRIIDAVRRGDIDSALRDLEAHYPAVVKDGDTPEKRAGGDDPNGNNAGIRFKLSCRKLVEMILTAAALAKKRTTGTVPSERPLPSPSDGMELDGESPTRLAPTLPASSASASSASNLTWKQQQKQRADPPATEDNPPYDLDALNSALECGMALTNHYGSDKRRDVQALMKLSSGLVAYDDPLNAGDSVSKFAGQDARNELADEVNAAILTWQGRRKDSALERLYRQTAGTVRQLAVMGEGLAAFVDVDREFGKR
ncbi:hypothetical protein FRB90_003229 [Tulasnella sp. 427]|nr:hypothetical protein FRB90_003229 [Tulasnella sp. 427]